MLIIVTLQVGIIVYALFVQSKSATRNAASSSSSSTSIGRVGHSIAVIVATLFISFPILVIVACGLGIDSNTTTSTSASASNSIALLSSLSSHEQYIPLSIAGTIVGNQLPSYVTSFVTCIVLTVFGLMSRPTGGHTTNTIGDGSPTDTNTVIFDRQTQDQSSTNKRSYKIGPIHAVLATFGLCGVLLLENFLVWVVSATYYDSQQLSTLPKPLQDNGKIVIRYFINDILKYDKHSVVKLRNSVNVQWLLVTGLGLSLATVVLYTTNKHASTKCRVPKHDHQKQHDNRTLWTLAVRGLLTMCFARLIRTISFSITVLPSQNTHCYFNHFPTPPPDALSREWFLIGLIPQSNGGCNDLIISGHATVTTTMTCIIISIVNKSKFSVALYMLLIFDYIIEIYEGFHYSVDMFLGFVVVNLIWITLQFIEQQEQQQTYGENQERSHDKQQMDNEIDTGGQSHYQQQQQKKEDLPHQQQLQSQRSRSSTVSSTTANNITTAKLPDIIRYFIPPFIAYTQVTNILSFLLFGMNGNYTIILYIVFSMIRVSQIGFDHYTQHVLFCLLYMALGIYL